MLSYHLINRLLERVGGAPSPLLITLPSLIVIGLLKLAMHLFENIMLSRDKRITRLNSCGQLNLSHDLLKLVAIALAKVEKQRF